MSSVTVLTNMFIWTVFLLLLLVVTSLVRVKKCYTKLFAFHLTGRCRCVSSIDSLEWRWGEKNDSLKYIYTKHRFIVLSLSWLTRLLCFFRRLRENTHLLKQQQLSVHYLCTIHLRWTVTTVWFCETNTSHHLLDIDAVSFSLPPPLYLTRQALFE